MCLLSCFLVPSAAPHLVHCPLIPLEDIRAATENFSEARQIGEGAFGMVYRGTASDGTEWAVKRAKLMTNDFEKEVGQRVEQARAHIVHVCTHAHAHAHTLTHT